MVSKLLFCANFICRIVLIVKVEYTSTMVAVNKIILILVVVMMINFLFFATIMVSETFIFRFGTVVL